LSRSHTRTRRLAFALAIGLPLAALVVFFAWPVAAMLARGLGPEALGLRVDPLGAARCVSGAAPATWTGHCANHCH